MWAARLEIPVRSDHDYVAAFEFIILDLNLASWMYGVPSLELTTFTWGHMGIVPLSPDPARRSGGVFEWSRRRPWAFLGSGSRGSILTVC